MKAKMRKPRHVRADSLLFALQGARVLNPQQRHQISELGRLALEGLQAGRSDVQHVASLIDLLGISDQLCRLSIANDQRWRVGAAQHCLEAMCGRLAAGGGASPRPYELEALVDAVGLLAFQISVCSLSEFERAKEAEATRGRQALAGNVANGTTVIGLTEGGHVSVEKR